ncbi:MAG: alpha-L-fucosidase [Bacteroidota bacterium]
MKKKTITSASFTIVILLQNILAFQGNCQAPSGQKQTADAMKFEPTWESLQQYKVPDWFRNAKFGIWAHWGPQCQPEQGDWYGRFMYAEGSDQYKWHIAHYGHPSSAGFKEVIHDWKAENWDPHKLVSLYKRAGAQYFFAMANHHDNLDLWDSKYQHWNSVRVGPKKDIISGWAKAAKENNLPFGLSIHASHAWTWFETAQRADTAGQFKGIPYDGNLRKEDGNGKWWEGLDPQELYAQNHDLSEGSENIYSLWKQWDWSNGASKPSEEYCNKFYNRVIDLVNQFNPDLLYFDDTVLPFYPVNDVGLKIAAHFYNHNIATHEGKLEAVMFGKVLNADQKKCMVWDVERGAPDKAQPLAWQTCTCIGDWHYKKSIYENSQYKSARTVIHMLVDIVSKNGNMLLNIPVKGDGTIDEKEVEILERIAQWMEINKESIFNTRPWIVFGEGPTAELANPVNAAGFNEGKTEHKSTDIRFNQNGKFVYATTLGVPDAKTIIRSLGKEKNNGVIKKIQLLGSHEEISWKQTDERLTIEKPKAAPNSIALVFKIELR